MTAESWMQAYAWNCCSISENVGSTEIVRSTQFLTKRNLYLTDSFTMHFIRLSTIYDAPCFEVASFLITTSLFHTFILRKHFARLILLSLAYLAVPMHNTPESYGFWYITVHAMLLVVTGITFDLWITLLYAFLQAPVHANLHNFKTVNKNQFSGFGYV